MNTQVELTNDVCGKGGQARWQGGRDAGRAQCAIAGGMDGGGYLYRNRGTGGVGRVGTGVRPECLLVNELSETARRGQRSTVRIGTSRGCGDCLSIC